MFNGPESNYWLMEDENWRINSPDFSLLERNNSEVDSISPLRLPQLDRTLDIHSGSLFDNTAFIDFYHFSVSFFHFPN